MGKTVIWESSKRKIAELKPAEYNPRNLTDKEAKDLSSSLQKFDLADPIVINKDNTIIGGHQRIKVLQGSGVTEVDVRVPSRQLTPEEEKELNLRLNKNVGHWDLELLASFSEEFLANVGFEAAELDKIFAKAFNPKEDNVPAAPETAMTKIGDVYQLGRHRLLCGDSSVRNDVEKLMEGKKADMLFTDPPCGVDYSSKNAFLNKIDNGKRIQREIENDGKSIDEMGKFWLDAFTLLRDVVLKESSSYYICCAFVGGLFFEIIKSMTNSGLPPRHEIVWVKNNHVLGRTDFNYKHEPIIYGWGKKHKFYGGGEQKSSVWNYDKPVSSKLHPTMKPINLIINAILHSSARDMIVADMFLGSGSTLIACEETKRICYGMELDPRYCDVIINRWEDYTKEKAVLLNGQERADS